jgi:hypothetical protein
MSDAKDPYPIEPEGGAAPPPGGSASPPAGSPADDKPKPKIAAPGLLDDFEEDADFTEDPELDLAVGRKPKVMTGAPAAGATAAGEPAPEFVKPGWGEPKHWAIVGGVLLVAAVIATGVTAPVGIGAGQVAVRILLTIYSTLVSAGTGVVALFIAARLLEKRFGSVELGAARMFTAVSAFVLVQSLNLRLTPYEWMNNGITLILATGVYLLVIAATFQLWDRITLAYVAGSHMLLWLVMVVGMALSSALKVAPPPRTGPTPLPSPGATGAPAATAPPNATPIR